MSQSPGEFLGTARFRLRRRLGSGGMGVVYEALDTEADKLVALKALTRTEASHISRFKNEFRSLANVSHPNLVALYEFMGDGHFWFFTMELVHGQNFLEYVRPGYNARHTAASRTSTLRKTKTGGAEYLADYEAETRELDSLDDDNAYDASQDLPVENLLSKARLDLNHLNLAMRQLSEGLHGLHQTGKLHRDIKPSNVLVTKEGKVKILDFGLVAEVGSENSLDTFTFAGTPDYMSPEQGAQLPISRASDWYSVGVMLYQALTGRLPFSGKFFEVMMNKQNFDPPAPSELMRNVPQDLDDLCIRLLQRNPEDRPSGREILRILGHGKTGPLRPPLMSEPPAAKTDARFIGRARQLQQLADAAEWTRRGHTVAVHLHGGSGMGKTALARQFLSELTATCPNVLILEGRCYERESVPYKALDGIVDSLTRHLLLRPEKEAAELLPADILLLARLFPVMLQVDAVFNAPQRDDEIPDPVTLRRKAFAAGRELVSRLSAQRPVVLYIDDLQWSDADSINLLEDLLRPPEAPPLLLLTSFRSEDIETKPFLQSLLEKTGTEASREIQVGALSKTESQELLRSAFGDFNLVSATSAEAILREARGNPFLLEQLASYAAGSTQTSTTGITLAVMLEARMRFLPKGGRQFLNTLAVAGRPMNQEVVYQAAELSGDALALISSLRAAQFLRTSEGQAVELYHDRIRETLASQVDPAKAVQIHRRLAQAIETRGIDDPEALFEHYVAAGEKMRAATHAAAAARRSASALAFDRAAALYRRALEFSPGRGAEQVDLKRELAEALANAGRPAEAAHAYLEVAEDTSATRSLEFKRRAAQQLLMGGHIKEGLEQFRSVLAAVGFSLPAAPKRALASLLWKRLQIRLRGLNFRERDVSQISESDVVRVDTCWAVAAGLGTVDLIRGADFQSRHLLLALQTGEPYRVARALAFEAAQIASQGGRSRERAEQLAQRATELSERVGHPHAIGLSIWAKGIGAYLVGEWSRGAELCERAAEVLRDRCTGVAWELTIVQRFQLSCLLYLGELSEISRRVPVLLNAALEQGNLFAATELRTRLNLIWLAEDDPDKARNEVIEALKAWPQEGFHLQHYSSLFSLAQIELYTGDAEVAWRHLEGQWQALKHSMLLRIQILRIEANHLRARVALAASMTTGEASQANAASQLASTIEKENMPWATPLALLLRAGLANQRNEQDLAAKLLTAAIAGLESAEMQLYAMAARRCQGQLIGGSEGEQLIAQADQWMSRQKIKNPEAITRMLAPGF